VDEIYCYGEECRPIYDLWKRAGKPVELFHDFEDLIACLRIVLKPADVVLIKGSRSKQMWKILEQL
jgi:UDP-N-acetylmuramoyl-tripeptide--D-alanyl-D-alanine ligase